MAHLKLVAGTSVATQQELTRAEVTREEAMGASVAQLEAGARSAILKLNTGLDGLSVAELLAEMNHNRGGVTMPMAAALARNSEIRRVLRELGLHANAALPEQELDVHLFGIVIEPDRLLKAYPNVQPFATVLDGLTF